MSFEPQFKYRNLPEQLADHIVDLFAKGELAGGQRLYEKEICDLLGVSRVPVREAFRILGAQGVVRTEPNRGSFLADLGPDEMIEMLEIRLTVERIALRRLLKLVLANPSLLDELRDAIDNMRRAARIEDQLSYYRSDLAFHAKVVELSASPMLKPIWDSLSRAILVLLMRERNDNFDYDAAIKDHEVLVELIEQRKRTALDKEIERHITNTRDKRLGRASLAVGEGVAQ
ncbi:MAG TPA: GntR family transcriptional regulator [Mesorhizobium sp.]|jgi:DNA-binding GntR family transcriptional regulator|uniref:GntR family transcriptional regulator n=1 Tax=Mesorhizobium sp. TaxID=1871066 RepID=UPI002DDD5751|nr:GntR family transcriptional regulator [Mesorhizobium sp.]HEV2501678.1 GntR family transcriptional regulator [Mesorhizobium sp.]